MADKDIAQIIGEACRPGASQVAELRRALDEQAKAQAKAQAEARTSPFLSDAECGKVLNAFAAVKAEAEALPTSAKGESRYPVSAQVKADLARRFTYHAVKPGQPERYTLIRLHGRDLAELIVGNAPPGREVALALTKLEEVVMWANAAIARGES